MAKQRVLITVKTYPTLSRKYGETVCTAGVREDGTWVRIYPVPFRRLNEEMREATKQYDLFADNTWRETFKLIDKLPYSFSYKFEDAVGRQSELQVLDWEAGALYWNCLRSVNGDEPMALAKVRQKYFDEFLKKDLHFFLGTTQQFHFVAPNPWVIIGVLPIPYETQLGLF
jgi:hypothetical protein